MGIDVIYKFAHQLSLYLNLGKWWSGKFSPRLLTAFSEFLTLASLIQSPDVDESETDIIDDKIRSDHVYRYEYRIPSPAMCASWIDSSMNRNWAVCVRLNLDKVGKTWEGRGIYEGSIPECLSISLFWSVCRMGFLSGSSLSIDTLQELNVLDGNSSPSLQQSARLVRTTYPIVMMLEIDHPPVRTTCWIVCDGAIRSSRVEQSIHG